MTDDEYRELLRVVERPAPLPPEFTERVFNAMRLALEDEAPAPARVAAERRRWRLRVLPPLALAAAVLVTVLVASLVVDTTRAPSALAALQDARAKFKTMPGYHALVSVEANENNDDPDFETKWETEDWYQDAEHWRSAYVSSTLASAGAAGSYAVMTPDLFGEYDSSTNTFFVRPASEVRGDIGRDPSSFFDPSLQWWSTGQVGDRGKPSDQFFEDDCTATATQFIGRRATKLECESEPRDIELWLDDETGMLLKLSVFDVVREIKSIELRPDFAPDLFHAVAPQGAKTRWRGTAPPPPEYAVTLGAEISARFAYVGDRSDGAAIVQTTGTDLWILVADCRRAAAMACGTELARFDMRAGSVKAVVAAPEGITFDGAFADESGGVWAELLERPGESPNPRAFLQRIDLSTNQLAGDRIDVQADDNEAPGSTDGSVWWGPGRTTFVKVGPAETHEHALARVDLTTGQTRQFELGADVMGVRVVGDSVWATTSRADARNPYETVYELIEVDATTGQISRRLRTPGWPNGLESDGARLFTLYVDRGNQTRLFTVDVASGATSTVPVGAPGAEIGTMAVAAQHLWVLDGDGVTKLALDSLQPVGTIATGPTACGIAAASGSVWVTNCRDGSLVRIDVE